MNGDFLILLDYDLYLLGPSGRNLRRLTVDARVEGARFSPDGSKVVFNTYAGDLFLMNADGSRLQTLRSDGRAGDPSFSRDGSKVAFALGGTTDERSRIVAIAARPEAPLTTIVEDGPSSPYCVRGGVWPDGRYYGPVWSPVADHLAVLQDCFQDPYVSARVRIIGPQGKRIAAFGEPDDLNRLDFSPDARRLVYSVYFEGYTWLRVLDRRTGAVTGLTDPYEDRAGAAAWSPDGARIAADLSPDGGTRGVYTMRATDGSDHALVKAFPGTSVVTVMDWRAKPAPAGDEQGRRAQ